MRHRTDWPTPQPAPGGTTYLCTADDQGMGVSLIQSNYHGVGSGIGAGTAGFLLHDRGSGFNLKPDHPNEMAPGKRPMHTLSPTLWTRNGDLAMLLGTRGGDFQPQTLLQIATAVLWAGLGLEEAQAMPRWATQEWREPDNSIRFEPGGSENLLAELSARGHRIVETGSAMPGWGPVAAIGPHRDGWLGAADPRVSTTAAVAG